MSQTFVLTQAGFKLEAIIERQNQDVLIQLIGGDVPHYGVVTTVGPTTEPQTIALPSRPGHHHQEGVLTELMARLLKPVLQNNAVIVSGVHVNCIQPEQMQAMTGMVTTLSHEIGSWLTAHPREKVIERFAKR
ncbi:hypothetical protein FD04_GL002446 [Secundilactobacillus odoratitofui DSM 19909 = JCM 15043]|uniref:Prenylated flavin chaperone LpdD-like domain-containing protein n=1 Tax=Secundilactobacillus odoratitofui DSM 19909 = JCM 15043 TaxID=1423776 RepID=A0A0R1LVC1_9LACO|nr:hypothetical protein [Secundilactobacillus odoratitofui]KRK99670.1 hypothetical protein FD04_GL002446 [Secundilactobacillus odoratitofui DSM 19909 = JCM 15043]